MKEEYDFCILGAGLAGLSLAKSISDFKEADVLVLDPNGVAGGASGSPIGLVNPATGRYANQSWRAADSIHQTLKNLEDIASASNERFFKKSGVIRPALEDKIAERMKANLEESYWEPGWVEWLDEGEIESKYPGLNCVQGGVQVSCGVTVSIPEYLYSIKNHLTSKEHIEVIEGQAFDVKPHNNDWYITIKDGLKTRCKKLIVTAGIRTTDYDFFEALPLIPVKGQVLLMECDDHFPYESAVSAGGYFASLDGKTFVAGSTYEHKFDHENPDEYGEEYILRRLFKVMPQLKGKVKIIDRWAGVRASTPDRLPVLDKHPEIGNCYVMAGLGSKGLLYSSLLGYELAAHLTKESDLPTELSIDRFS